ncbi:type II toxin-antitoxin system PemK/MazF family toxin [Enterobacteriaceae bacterium 89]|nr:type II toxin-antitoxin system PemK/MazF family toxin [Enterobacteriaceae bacterium 89]
MKQGDIYLCDLEPVVGHEQGGKRPVLIVSSEAFNLRTRLPIVFPITTGGGFARRQGFALELPDKQDVKGVIRCDQPRTVDLGARKAARIDRLEGDVLQQALGRYYAIV